MRQLSQKFIICAIVLMISACAAAPSPVSVPTPTQSSPTASADERILAWRDDLKFLIDQIQKHPQPYNAISQAEMDALVESLEARIPELPDSTIIMEMQRLVAQLHDGHSLLALTQTAARFHFYPIQVYFFSDGLYIIAAQPQYESAIGKRIASINGVAVDEVYERLSPYVSGDNDSTILRNINVPFVTSEALLAAGIIEDIQQPQFILEDTTGAQEVFNPQPIEVEEYQAWALPPEAAQLSSGFRPFSEIIFYHDLPQQDGVLHLQRRYSDNFWYEYLADSGTLYIQYNFVVPTSSGQSMREFALEISRVAAEQNAARVVVDVRHNPGGDNANFEPLLNELSHNPSINQPGHLFILIGRYTFSAAAIFLVRLENTEAVFVGEPTGGTPDPFDNAAVRTLPNSDLIVTISSRYPEFVPETDTRITIEPDLLVEFSSADYFRGDDPVLNAAINAPSP